MPHVKVFIVILLILNVFKVKAQTSQVSAAQIDQSGVIHCSNGTTMMLSDLIKARGAVAVDFNASASIPITCVTGVKEKVDAMVEQFKQEDLANKQGLANNFCSHISGWVEKVPGTCSAGGPPPICVEDHWKYVGGYEAIANFSAQNRKKAVERAAQMAKLGSDVCSCTVNELKIQDQERWKNSNFNQPLSTIQAGQQAVKSSLRITCMGGCPPGYTCKNGYCEEDEATLEKKVLDKLVDKTKEAAKDKAVDYAKDKVMSTQAGEILKEALAELSAIGSKYVAGFSFVAKYSTFFSSAALGIIDPDGGIPDVKIGSFVTGKMSGGNELYMNCLAQVNGHINQLTSLYNEIIRLNTGQNQVRYRNYITDDIAKERTALANQLQLLDGYRREVTWTCKGCCDQMLDYQHQSVVDYANKIKNVNIE